MIFFRDRGGYFSICHRGKGAHAKAFNTEIQNTLKTTYARSLADENIEDFPKQLLTQILTYTSSRGGHRKYSFKTILNTHLQELKKNAEIDVLFAAKAKTHQKVKVSTVAKVACALVRT